MDELYNFCFCSLLDGGTDHTPLTLEDAAYNLECIREYGSELPEEVTPEMFMHAWNETIVYLDRVPA